MDTKLLMSKKHSSLNRIFINDTPITIYAFDTEISLLERYSIEAGMNNKILPTIPQFLKFKRKIDTFEPNGKYKVEDIRNSFSLNIKDLTEVIEKYPYLNVATIYYIWFIENKYYAPEISIDDFVRAYKVGNFDQLLKSNKSFSNARIAYISIDKYYKNVLSMYSKIRSRVQKESIVYDKLLKAKPVELDEFLIEGATEQFILKFDGEVSLYEIFNLLRATELLPFIALSDGKNFTYKVYKNLKPLPEWLDIQHVSAFESIIYFYVLDTPDAIKLDEDMYRIGSWSENHVIRVDSRGTTTYFDTIIEKLKNTSRNLGSKTISNFEIIEQSRYETRGKFSVRNQTFNKAIFAELMLNDPTFSYFLIADESKKSILDKKRFVFYHKSLDSTKDDITITMTDFITDKISHVDVRISRAKDENQIYQFMMIFKYLFGLYLEKIDSVINLYTGLFKKVNFKKYGRTIVEKHADVKTGKRLKLLELHNPEAFKIGGYSSKCQPKRRQPYLVNKNDLEKVKAKLASAEPKELGKELEKHGLLNWPEGSDDWYACYPREDDDDEKKHIWPGLIKQKEKASNYYKYPSLPCCFIVDQFTKKGAKTTKKTDVVDEKDDDNFERPLSSNKNVPRGRYAELPYYIQLVAILSEYKSVEYRNKTFLPILRYGVVDSPSSFVHCMERAFNHKYSLLSLENKKAQVENILGKIFEKDDEWFVVCRQEMYADSYSYIREKLVEKNNYIDPDLYVNLFSKYYDCNIIVFKVDKDHPKGELSLPNYASAYLSYKFNPKTETVVIIKTQNKSIYQCELVVKYENKDNSVSPFFNSNDKFVTTIFELINKINKVYITSPDSDYAVYDPQILL